MRIIEFLGLQDKSFAGGKSYILYKNPRNSKFPSN